MHQDDGRGPGLPISGKQIIRGACSRIAYTAKKDGKTYSVDVDGWRKDGHPGARIPMFGQRVTVLAMGQGDYPSVEQITEAFFTKEQLALLDY